MKSRAVLVIIFATGTILGISYGMFGSIVPVFAKDDVGATYPELAMIGAAYFVPYMFVPLLVGLMLVRYNNSYMLVGGVVLNVVSIYMLSVADSAIEIAIYRMMTGLGLALFWPSCQTIISNVCADEDRSKNLSRFVMFYVMGFMIGPLIGNVLIENGIEYRMLFQLAAAVMLAAIISIMTSSHKSIQEAYKPSFGMFKQFVKYPLVLAMTAYCAISFGAILAIYPAFLRDTGITDTDILLLYFVFGAARMGTLALSSKLAKRADITLIGTAFATVIGLMISYMSASTIGFAVAMIFLGFGFSIFFPFMLNLILSRNSRGVAGALIGGYEAIFGVGWAVGPMFAGYMSEFYGIGATYLAFSAFGICIGIMAIIRRRSLRPIQSAH